MSEVTQRIVAAYEALGKAVQESLTGNGSEAVPEPTPEPDEFKHIDEDGDALSVRPQRPEQPEWLIVGCHARGDEDPARVLLRPHDVNRLAQYLDQHRTDIGTEPVAPAEHWCGSDSDHAEHVSEAQGVPLRCLGAYAGRYGLSPDHLPGFWIARGHRLCVCGHELHAGICRQPGLSSPDCPCTTARYAG